MVLTGFPARCWPLKNTLFLRFLYNPAVTGAIVGARSAEQVERNIGAADLQLTDEDVDLIEGTREPALVNAA